MMKKGEIDCYFPKEIIIEIIIEIISWLPVKSLLRFKCVSKTWYDSINDPKFIKLHLNRSNLDTTVLLDSYDGKINLYSCKVNCLTQYPYYEVSEYCHSIRTRLTNLVGSCNGLLCLNSYIWPHGAGDFDVMLYNPATRAFKTLPRFDFMMGCSDVWLNPSFVFGYDGVSDDYKVLKFTTAIVVNVEQNISGIYSLKTNNWEIIENPPWEIDDYVKLGLSNVLANNSFHWLILKSDSSIEIKCFDLFTRRYYDMPLPDDKNARNNSPRLTVLRGKLCIVTYNLDIWMMKEYGMDKSWTRLFHYKEFEQCNSFGTCFIHPWNHIYTNLVCLIHEQNIFLLEAQKCCSPPKANFLMICCDQKSQEARKIEMPSLPDDTQLAASTQPWAESLVPLS